MKKATKTYPNARNVSVGLEGTDGREAITRGTALGRASDRLVSGFAHIYRVR